MPVAQEASFSQPVLEEEFRQMYNVKQKSKIRVQKEKRFAEDGNASKDELQVE